jgi:predicted DNA-binding transcriptional regulator YafY
MPATKSNQTLPRMLEILKHIPREPRMVDVKRLCELLDARGFEAQQRTVQRDLNSLASVFPIGNRGRVGEAMGWFWPKDAYGVTFPLPSVESLLSLFLVDRYLLKMTPPFMQRELNFIVPRIDNLVKMPSDRGILEQWNRFVRFIPSHFQTESPTVATEVYEAAFEAFSSRKQLSVTYRSVAVGADEKVIPLSVHGLVYKPPVLYLVATAYRYTDVRAYALHRVTAAEVLPDAVTAMPDFSLDEFIAKGGLSITEGAPTKIVLSAREGLIRYLQEAPLSKDQVITLRDEADGTEVATVEATITPSRAFTNWLLSVAPYVQVVEPFELREEIRTLLHKAVVAYD